MTDLSRDLLYPSRLLPDVRVTYYSIPALDETGGPIQQRAGDIASGKFRVTRPSVLISLLNPRIPRVFLAPGSPDSICSTEFAVLMPKASAELLPEYLGLLASGAGFREELASRVAGTTGSRQRVRPSSLDGIRVLVPSLGEQRRIIDLVSALDEAMSMAHEVSDAARCTLLSLAGKCWVESTQRLRLGAIGRAVTGSTPATAIPRYWSTHEVPFFTPGDFGDAQTLGAASRSISADGAAAVRLLTPPAVLQVCIGSIGKVAVLEVTGCTNQQINALVGLDSVDAHALAALLASSPGQSLIMSLAGATTLPLINKSNWASMQVPWPSREIRVTLVNLVRQLDEVVAHSRQVRSRLQAVRTVLLDDLLSGNHEIPESYDRFLTDAA